MAAQVYERYQLRRVLADFFYRSRFTVIENLPDTQQTLQPMTFCL